MDLADKDFKAAIANTFKEVKEAMLEEWKKVWWSSHKILNINDEIEIIKKNQIKILWLKSTITEIKNSLEWFNSRLELIEENQWTLK